MLSWAGLIGADLAGPEHPKSLQESSGHRDKMGQVEAWLVVPWLWLNVRFGGAGWIQQTAGGRHQREAKWDAVCPMSLLVTFYTTGHIKIDHWILVNFPGHCTNTRAQQLINSGLLVLQGISSAASSSQLLFLLLCISHPPVFPAKIPSLASFARTAC